MHDPISWSKLSLSHFALKLFETFQRNYYLPKWANHIYFGVRALPYTWRKQIVVKVYDKYFTV